MKRLVALLAGPNSEAGVARFRAKMLAGMALVVSTLTLAGLSLAERSVRAETRHDLQIAFSAELALQRTTRDIRHATLAERCRSLVRKPRIRAALEDHALDLLYPSAKDELGEPLRGDVSTDSEITRHSLQPRFYRFLDINGAVIPPPSPTEFGELTPDEEKHLALEDVPREQIHGCLARTGEIVELIVTPIHSTETEEAIATLIASFPVTPQTRPANGLRSGLWLDGALHMHGLDESAQHALETEITRALARTDDGAVKGLAIRVNGAEHMLFCELLNPGSPLPPTYEIGVYPVAELLARQNQLRWKALASGLLLLAVGVAASFYVAARLADPLRKLAAVLVENRELRDRAEASLKVTRNELDRAARFSANASHQLKTPVAVLRAGLDELLANPALTEPIREELSALVHQTFRLSSIIEDLLLLSRLDSGRLHLDLTPVDLAHLVVTCVDDLHLLHPAAPEVQVEIPPALRVLGDISYTLLIVQNLLENAHKYGRPGEPIRVTTRVDGGSVTLLIANRGEPVPEASREQIFERFHRAAAGGAISGHGLGLNLARELARLHGGDLRLTHSDAEWTKFELRLRAAHPDESRVAGPAAVA